jgi:hypothetical protein
VGRTLCAASRKAIRGFYGEQRAYFVLCCNVCARQLVARRGPNPPARRRPQLKGICCKTRLASMFEPKLSGAPG